ncbi:hypothetical protein VHEMI06200 [[Torrubiella] hemipterigena]|uniref:NmrA-like domain-containing protein n=1 Tax=[Torrubiella] hemipterigena TaxID=1531966 RepID=A0A0A1TKI6_9HYPO|nr:hypothetical protein VHEMI06200 [[Torrubiella] hemipterigena]
MTTMTSKLVLVYSATSRQGESVVRSLLDNASGAFKVRGTTRDVNSDKSKSLIALGVEMVSIDAAGGLESLGAQALAAFDGCWGAFINIDSYNPVIVADGGPSVYDYSKIVVDAAAKAGVQHIVHSSLPPSSEISDGLISIDYFDDKDAINTYIKANPQFRTTTAINAGWYLENFLDKRLTPVIGGFPFTAEDGCLILRLPSFGGNGSMHFVDIEQDFGDFVHGVLVDPEVYNGASIQGFSVLDTPEALVQAFTQVTGKTARYVEITPKEFSTHGSRGLLAMKKEILYCQYNGGLFYGEPSDLGPAATLKAIAAEARGRRPVASGNSGLSSVLDFVKQHFARDSSLS